MKLLGVKTLRALVDNKSQQIIESVIKAYLVYLRTKRKIYTLDSRIYPKDQPIPYDSDNWLQCYNCGQITSKVHTKQQNEIAPIVDPPETIHDSKKVVVLTTKGGFFIKKGER
jgi:lysozyme family protein